MPSLSDRIDLLHVSPIRRVTSLLVDARKQGDIISFGGGAPSLPPPREVTEEMRRVLAQNALEACGYTGTRGFLELRRLIAEDFKKHEGTRYDEEKEVILTDGATEAIYAAFLSLINKNDEVVLTDPTYLGYREAARLAGARVVSLPVDVEKGYQPDLERLKTLITKRTKMFVLLSPDNPTGRVVTQEFAKGLVDLAVDSDFWIIYDATYRNIVYEGDFLKVSSLSGARDRALVVGSFSKEVSIPGLRLGYAFGPATAINAVEKIKQYTSLAPNTLSQYGVMKFFEGTVKEDYLKNVVLPTYMARRDFMGKCIEKYMPEAQTAKPSGAFYFFVNVERYLSRMNRDERDLCNRLLERKSVVAIPGSFFGKNGEQHIRLTFVSEPEARIETGLRAVGEYLFSYAF